MTEIQIELLNRKVKSVVEVLILLRIQVNELSLIC